MNDDELPGLTAKLNAYRGATIEEREQLWESLFPALKRMASGKISAANLAGRESATELVVEQYEGLHKALAKTEASWANRKAFFGYAAISMRHALVAKAKRTAADELLDEERFASDWSATLILSLEQALDEVGQQYPRHVMAFMLRHYLGHSHAEIMEIMSDSYNTPALLASDLTVARKALIKALTA